MNHVNDYKIVDKYKEGEYVIIKDNDRVQYLRDKWKIFPYLCVQIEQVLSAYYVETIDLKTNKLAVFWVKEDDIDRKATKDEIDEYELQKDSKKYNL